MSEALRQLRAISEWQRHLLPRCVPQPAGWRLAVHYQVGRWPGGDYYDFLPFPDGRLMFLIAGASGQGALSSAMVAIVRVMLHSCPLSSAVERLPFCPMRDAVVQSPHMILGHLNQVLAENTLEEQFLTCFCGVLDPLDGNLHYTNAGHPWPRWWRSSRGTLEALDGATGQALGLDRHATYRQQRIEIEPGDMLLLHSEGLTAALNGGDRIFGRVPLDDALREGATDGAEAVKDGVLARLTNFLGGREIQDDVTLLVIERCFGT
jgi:sigma-B regulation protein RsbU (phosphoserine phosphatase)